LTRNAAAIVMQVELVTAKRSDRQRLENLLELYMHDFSEILGFTPGEDGRFGYAGLDAYFSQSDRLPFMIRADQRLAGFALVGRGSQVSGDPSVFDVAEFFVVRGLRRHGVGQGAAAALFSLFPGTWEVRVVDRNQGGQLFWKRAVTVFTHGNFESGQWRSPRGTNFLVLRFASPPQPRP